MAKDNKNKQKTGIPKNEVVVKDSKPAFAFLANFKVQAALLAVIGFVFYFNTFHNDYAVDDFLIIAKSPAVNSGIAGIPEIMSSDIFESYYREYNADNRLSGGRYRPLSLVTYAIEQQIFGETIDASDKNPSISEDAYKKIITVRHVDNVLLYILSVVVLLYFLRKIVFPEQPLIAFLSALLFTIHPIHTEVVANIKSRDEILSLLFISLTFIYTFKYKEHKKISALIISLVCFFLALLSKEYAVTLIVLIPMMLYLLKDYSPGKSLKAALPYLGALALYLVLRFSMVSFKGSGEDNELLNNPYLLASPMQKIATEIATLLNYLKLLVFPHPLSVDYSYNQIPYKSFASPLFWLSLLVHGALFVMMLRLLKKKHILSFAIAFYLFHLFLVSNLPFSIGATMGERLIYHSSLGFCMALAYFLNMAYEKIKPQSSANAALAGAMLLVVLLCGVKTIARNADWKNNSTLYLKDAETATNSALANGNGGASYNELANLPENAARKTEMLNKAIVYLNKAIAIHPKYTMAYMNRGTSYFELGDVERAKQDWDSVKKFYPTYPALPDLYASYYINSAISKYGNKGQYNDAIAELRKGAELAPKNAVLWYNMGYYYSVIGKNDSAILSWQRIISETPNDTLAAKAAASIKVLSGRK